MAGGESHVELGQINHISLCFIYVDIASLLQFVYLVSLTNYP